MAVLALIGWILVQLFLGYIVVAVLFATWFSYALSGKPSGFFLFIGLLAAGGFVAMFQIAPFEINLISPIILK